MNEILDLEKMSFAAIDRARLRAQIAEANALRVKAGEEAGGKDKPTKISRSERKAKNRESNRRAFEDAASLALGEPTTATTGRRLRRGRRPLPVPLEEWTDITPLPMRSGFARPLSELGAETAATPGEIVVEELIGSISRHPSAQVPGAGEPRLRIVKPQRGQ